MTNQKHITNYHQIKNFQLIDQDKRQQQWIDQQWYQQRMMNQDIYHDKMDQQKRQKRIDQQWYQQRMDQEMHHQKMNKEMSQKQIDNHRHKQRLQQLKREQNKYHKNKLSHHQSVVKLNNRGQKEQEMLIQKYLEKKKKQVPLLPLHLGWQQAMKQLQQLPWQKRHDQIDRWKLEFQMQLEDLKKLPWKLCKNQIDLWTQQKQIYDQQIKCEIKFENWFFKNN